MAVASSSRKPASAEAAWTQVHKFLSPSFEYSIVRFEIFQGKNIGSCNWHFNWCITHWYQPIIFKAISVIIHNKDFVKLQFLASNHFTKRKCLWLPFFYPWPLTWRSFSSVHDTVLLRDHQGRTFSWSTQVWPSFWLVHLQAVIKWKYNVHVLL